MRELRLIDPGTVHLNVPEANVQAVKDRLEKVTAPKHAADHDGINGYRFHAADYRVQNLPQPAVAARGTFLDLLTLPAAT